MAARSITWGNNHRCLHLQQLLDLAINPLGEINGFLLSGLSTSWMQFAILHGR